MLGLIGDIILGIFEIGLPPRHAKTGRRRWLAWIVVVVVVAAAIWAIDARLSGD